MKQIGRFLSLVSAVCCMGWLWEMKAAREREIRFEPVGATVVANRVHKEWVKRSIAENQAAEYTNQYRAEYQLQYTYEGQTYRQWESDPLTSTQRYRAEAVLGQMSPGSKLTVYVDPQNPKRITLHPGDWRVYQSAIVLGVLSALSGIVALGMLWWRGNREREEQRSTSVVYLN